MVLPCLSWKGLPLATDQVSQGGAKMAACTWPECIWCFQKSMVVCCDRSLWGVLSLERSMEMGRSVKDSLVCACRSCDCMSSYLRLPEKK